MSGEAVLNILNSTRFAEKFRDFSWAELSVLYSKQRLFFHFLKTINRELRSFISLENVLQQKLGQR